MTNGERVVKRRFWMSWNVRKEEQWLTDLSAQGLHLTKPNVMRQEFVKDDAKRYVYRLDFQQNARDQAEFANYVQLFADAGWEYVGSVSGIWHYFRKVRQGEETDELYTDRTTLKEFYRRVCRVLGAVAFANLPLFAFNIVNVLSRYAGDRMWTLTVPVLTVYAAVIGVLFYGFVRMGRTVRRIDAE